MAAALCAAQTFGCANLTDIFAGSTSCGKLEYVKPDSQGAFFWVLPGNAANVRLWAFEDSDGNGMPGETERRSDKMPCGVCTSVYVFRILKDDLELTNIDTATDKQTIGDPSILIIRFNKD